MSQIRILLVDDHKILVDAVKKLVEQEFEVIGTFENGRELLDNAPKLRPDVIVLDMAMPAMNGLLVAERIKKLLPHTKLIFLTMNRDPEFVAEAFRLGASGYILKSATGRELIQAIRTVISGGYYASPEFTKTMAGEFGEEHKKAKSPHQLSARQKEVLQLLAEGSSMKQIATILNIAEPTVAYHKYSMMKLLNIKSNAELLGFARSALPPTR
ncbi:MAG TPA: response regulator transcription factor [Pyrinomonadaceae bacterium]|nr:response regulator transcription factor [Pyrinomonadaceae bacterium]